MKSYIETGEKQDCFGCRACEKICPKGCINMKEDEEGFLYPVIDREKCIFCQKCIKICPHKEYKSNTFTPEVYAAQTKNKKILSESSSGGIFSEIANYILDKDGIVFGTTMTKDNNVEFISVTNNAELSLLRGSKYVQSDTMNTYKEVKMFADEKRLILYIGTPCQIAGLNQYLQKKYDNVITVDIVCHGVPSKKFFNKYVDYIKNKNNSSKVEIFFRDKSINGWSHTLKCVFEKNRTKKEKYYTPQTSSYYYAFINAFNYRESCYKCLYANMNRVSDITIGDFWNLNNDCKNRFNWKDGLSLVIINSNEGKKLFQALEEKINYYKSNIETAQKGNVQLSKPVERKKIRDNIYIMLDEMDYSEIEKKYLRSNKYLKYKIRSYIGIKLKKIKQIIRSKK